MKLFKKGQALVEMMVGMGIAAAIMPALVTSFFAARGGSAQEQVRMQAQGRLREAREVLRLLKQANWSNVSTPGTYHLILSGGAWGIALNPPVESNLDGLFTRQIILAKAYRNTITNQLSTVSSPGVNIEDPSVMHAQISVAWDKPIASSVVSDYYLMRLENLTWVQTTVSDFTAGTQTGTAITNTGGGEVVLGSGGAGHADWCAPSLTSIDYNISGTASPNALSAKVGTGTNPNQVIAGTGNSANGVSLVHLSVTNAPTPAISVVGTMPDSSPRIKTNAVFNDSTHAYITTDTNSKEVVIVDLTAPTRSEVGYFDAPINGNGAGIYVVGNIGFVTVNTKLYTFDLSSKTGDRGLPLATYNLTGTGARLVVNGSYIYVSESSGSRPLEIIEFSNGGATLTSRGFFTSSGQNGVDIAVNSTGTRGYLATSQGKVHILNISDPSSPVSVGTPYDTNGMTPRGVSVVTNNKAIVVGTGGSLQYQVIDIENEGSPSLCTRGGTTSGGLIIPSGVNGISSVQEEDSDTYSYIITGDASAELKIIQGGGGGGGGTYASDGMFESSIFDPGFSVMFNRFDVTASALVDTTIGYQFAITSPSGGGTCANATYVFVGPSQDTSLWFSGSSSLPVGSANGYSNPGQCLKYRVHMTTSNTNSTPVFYDLTLNYSP